MEVLLSLATKLQQDVPMSLADSFDLPMSFASFYYKSKAWNDRKKQIDYESQIQMAVIKRLDLLISQRR